MCPRCASWRPTQRMKMVTWSCGPRRISSSSLLEAGTEGLLPSETLWNSAKPCFCKSKKKKNNRKKQQNTSLSSPLLSSHLTLTLPHISPNNTLIAPFGGFIHIQQLKNIDIFLKQTKTTVYLYRISPMPDPVVMPEVPGPPPNEPEKEEEEGADDPSSDRTIASRSAMAVLAWARVNGSSSTCSIYLRVRNARMS